MVGEAKVPIIYKLLKILSSLDTEKEKHEEKGEEKSRNKKKDRKSSSIHFIVLKDTIFLPGESLLIRRALLIIRPKNRINELS